MSNGMYVPQRVMAIVAHPDDIEFGSVGTIARWVKAGATAAYVLVTSGDVGIAETGMTKAKATEIREAETLAAAQLVGINVRVMLRLAYGLSAGLGALAGILIAPITFSSYEAGVMLGLKGFSAAIVGGIGNPMGAVAGGLLLGVLESLGAGLISSGYKDAIAFLFVLMVLFFEPTGLFGHKVAERV